MGQVTHGFTWRIRTGPSSSRPPLVLLKQIQTKGVPDGDCDDHVVLLGALMKNAIGIQARTRRPGSSWYGANDYNHVVIQYPLNGQMVLVDPRGESSLAASFDGERSVVRLKIALHFP